MTLEHYIDQCRTLGIPSFALRDCPESIPSTVPHREVKGYKDERSDYQCSRGRNRIAPPLDDMSMYNPPTTKAAQKRAAKAWDGRRITDKQS